MCHLFAQLFCKGKSERDYNVAVFNSRPVAIAYHTTFIPRIGKHIAIQKRLCKIYS